MRHPEDRFDRRDGGTDAVVLVFAWLMVFITGAQGGLASLDGMTLLFLALSGLATGASWLCYFKALQLGDINKVVPIDKSSILLTMLLAFLLLGEPFHPADGGGVYPGRRRDLPDDREKGRFVWERG